MGGPACLRCISPGLMAGHQCSQAGTLLTQAGPACPGGAELGVEGQAEEARPYARVQGRLVRVQAESKQGAHSPTETGPCSGAPGPATDPAQHRALAQAPRSLDWEERASTQEASSRWGRGRGAAGRPVGTLGWTGAQLAELTQLCPNPRRVWLPCLESLCHLATTLCATLAKNQLIPPPRATPLCAE